MEEIMCTQKLIDTLTRLCDEQEKVLVSGTPGLQDLEEAYVAARDLLGELNEREAA